MRWGEAHLNTVICWCVNACCWPGNLFRFGSSSALLSFKMAWRWNKSIEYFSNPVMTINSKAKPIWVFQVSWSYLGFCPDPKHFILSFEDNSHICCKMGGTLVKKCNICRSVYSVVTLKMRSKSPKSNSLITMIQYIKFGQRLSFGSRDRLQTNLFWSKFYIHSAGVTLKMRSRSLKSNHFFPCLSSVSLQVWWKSINWFRR